MLVAIPTKKLYHCPIQLPTLRTIWRLHNAKLETKLQVSIPSSKLCHPGNQEGVGGLLRSEERFNAVEGIPLDDFRAYVRRIIKGRPEVKDQVGRDIEVADIVEETVSTKDLV